MAAPQRYIGMISGTSMDGVDLAALDFRGDRFETIETGKVEYPEQLKCDLLEAISPDAQLSLHQWAELNIRVGRHFATAANAFIAKIDSRTPVCAIGSHGQTLRHHPLQPLPYTIQIGDPATIAVRTGIVTVADFRSLDLARGGQGAPLVPPFHEACFGAVHETAVIVNIGGIANITALQRSQNGPPQAWDTGPGNCLMDEWALTHLGQPYDREGAWSSAGTVHDPLLKSLLDDPYFRARPPKSTGREYFNHRYVAERLARHTEDRFDAVDVQATLRQFSVETIARDLEQQPGFERARVYVCGGGSHNAALMAALAERLAPRTVTSTAKLGIDPDYVEASAFAWFAYRRMTGAAVVLATSDEPRPSLLGAIYDPRSTTPPLI